MTPNHLATYSGIHLRSCFRFAFGLQTAGYVVEVRCGETAGGFPEKGFFPRRWLARIALAVAFFPGSDLQSLEVLPKSVANQRGTIAFGPAGGSIRRL
jgi:hypothetical protein